jgi:uncharacterized protein
MTKQFWINLPVKDINRSKEFYKNIGFKFNTNYPENPNGISLLIGDHNVVVMLFDEATFQSYSGAEIPKTGEVLLSIDAENKEEIDTLIEKVIAAGGASTHKPSEMTGWMYGCLFTDPDGHRWNPVYMDFTKMPR